MTYREDSTLPREITELVNAAGFDILPELLRLIFNTAMQVEREQYLGAGFFRARTALPTPFSSPLPFSLLRFRSIRFSPDSI